TPTTGPTCKSYTTPRPPRHNKRFNQRPALPNDPTIQLSLPHRIRFTRSAFDVSNSTLADVFDIDGQSTQKVLIAVDQGIVEAMPKLQEQVETYFADNADKLPKLVGFRAVVGGEQSKNDLSQLESFLGEIDAHHLDRHSYILVIGGGAVLDMVGFAAAVAHRGIRLVRMPTTTLAQADSGVGVKNGVNMFGKKNFIGAFAVPWAVVNDLTLLDTLDDREWRSGLSEAVKVGLLKDAGLYRLISKRAEHLGKRDRALADDVIQRSAHLHLQHIAFGGDPFEMTTARPLDFGHWSGHKLEQLTNFAIKHGEGVALGLALDVTYCEIMGILAPEVAADIRRTLETLGFDLYHPAMDDADALLNGLDEFREHLGGQLTITLIKAPGKPINVHEIDRNTMAAALGKLKEIAQAAPVA
ncbi:MAG: 3-dehydroquinate synthase, partial [Phycisphaeraceae bacterium]